jgi:CheY-like chemotaxis protein
MARPLRWHESEVGPAPSILVVDADAAARAIYTQSCALAGWDVVEASDGREALTEALVRPPTLVITEIRLPLVDGFALCEILRRDWATAAVPILVVTAETGPAEGERARRAGADTVLIKPVSSETILGEMRRVLRGRAAAPRGGAVVRSNGSATRVAAHSRVATTMPSSPRPALLCPSCECPLTYRCSRIGGVSTRDPEQWDYYVCPASCGTFQFRHRTRKLRRVDNSSRSDRAER